MTVLARWLRALAKLRFRALGLATIKDIPTKQFNELAEKLIAAGWRKTSEYEGVDAWIDYGRIRMRKGRVRLTLEWDNWTEGSIEGPRTVLEDIAHEFGMRVGHEWRWAEFDEPR